MWQTVWNWPWVTIWAAISAIFTAGTACVAGWALFRWRKQDELKAKMAFKQAIADYLYALLLPVDLSEQKVRVEYYDLIMNLISKFNQCRNTLLYCEGLLDKEINVLAHWHIIYNKHSFFVKGKEDSSDLHNACDSILKINFIFK